VKYYPSSYTAFSLVELTLAMGVAAISLLAIFGLLATGVQINHTSIEQTASAEILTSVAADLRATPPTTNTSLQFGIIIPTNTTLFFDATGQSSRTLTSVSRYRMVVTFLPTSGRRTATRLDLRITWPAGADPANANTRASEMFVALDRN
jgi:uncharacterized protein (TIGR02598 family)